MVLEAPADLVRGVGIGVVVVSSGGEGEQRGLTQPRLHLRLVQYRFGTQRVVGSGDDPTTIDGRMGV